MNRRETLQVLLALGAAIAPLRTIAQQAERMRRIGVLLGWSESDPEAQLRLSAFKERLGVLGWTEGRNLKTEVRWSAGDVNRAAAYAKELVALKPEVILVTTTPATAAFKRETQTIPIVFSVVSDPVGSGFVASLARPGGNITGFINLESSLAGKWLQLLTEIAPGVKRVAVIFNPQTSPFVEYYLQPLRVVAQKMDIGMRTAEVRTESDIEEAISRLGREPGSGLIVMTDSFVFVHRRSIIASTARNKVPAIYYSGTMAEDGGLIAYGVDVVDLVRRSALHVDRILRGAKPSELPVEQPSKFDMVVNVKTARALGLTVPRPILLRADRVIE